MSLRVIGAGFGRTGTLSLKVALEKLGFGPCHHMKEVMKNQDQTEWFHRASKGEKVDWHKVFEKYQSAVDWPAAAYYQELANEFPDAKIVLGVRDVDAWYQSVSETIYTVVPNFPKWLRLILPRANKVMDMIDRTIWIGEFSGRFEDKEFAVDVFNKHIELVKTVFPEERLLIHSAKDGWQPLCDFLEVPVPDEPYPWLNESINFKRNLRIIKAVKWMPLVLVIILLLKLLY